MKYFKIYLSGGMMKFGAENFNQSNNWREYCKNALKSYESNYDIDIFNPNDYFCFKEDAPKYTSEFEVMNFDLRNLRNSDLVIVNFNDKWSLGTISEIAIAYDRGIPVIGLDIDKQELHSWQKCFCERIFDDIDEMLDYVEDFYLR